MIDESVGENFKQDSLRLARDKTLAVVEEAITFVRPGLSEDEMKVKIEEIQQSHGIPENWHKPQVRFGENSTLPFGIPGKTENTLKESDIGFIDLGIIIDGHEGDVGRPFYLGNDPNKIRCCEDASTLWFLVKEYWEKTSCTGKSLYQFASNEAEKMGWLLSLKKANGHRISDFPHVVKKRGTIVEYENPLASDRWILEIQILDKSKKFGAFYEDLLN